MIAEIVLNSTAKATDNIYHYEIPHELDGDVKIGMRVAVAFGNGNKPSEAYVVGLTDKSEFDGLKQILYIVDDDVYFDSDDVELAKFMHHRYFCSYAQALKTILPVGVNIKFTRTVFLEDAAPEKVDEAVKNSAVMSAVVAELRKCSPLSTEKLSEYVGRRNIMQSIRALEAKGIVKVEFSRNDGIKDTYALYVSLSADRTDAFEFCDRMAKSAKAQVRALELLCDNDTWLLSELMEYAGVSKASVDSLVEKGYAVYSKRVVRDDILCSYSVEETEPVELSDEQRNAVDVISKSIENDKYETYLIHGVTGSGKTEVYLRLIEKVIKRGKKAILLVPEISLTPQMVSRVVSRFCGRVAVLHSSLTVKERYNEWKKIKEGRVDVAVGARSAVFAPFKDIGLIVIDEEHESTYKSESSPRYSAVEAARFRAMKNNAALVLASATPSVESYYKAQSGKYKLVEMKSRVSGASMPSVQIVDMRRELENGNMSIFSSALSSKISKNINKGRQTILFLNRRGYSNFVSCRSCGYVVKCPHCNVSMTYHRVSEKMICHYCDYMTEVPHVCPSCGSRYIKYFGTGTQRVTEEIEKLFPGATYLRMDADTTARRMSHKNILKEFHEKNINILVGTQMITKGLDFENVTLVGILSADTCLNQEDYRAAERTFDLITQVEGRSGRGKYHGEAVIQTYCPDDETILLSARQEYREFYDNEIRFRNMMNYPPFCEFINIVFTDTDAKKAKDTAERFYNDLSSETDENKLNNFIQMCEPSPAPLHIINDKYRYRILAKTRYNKALYDALGALYGRYCRSIKNAGIVIDVNPVNLY